MDGSSGARCLVDLTPQARDYLLRLIEEERVQLHAAAARRRVLLFEAQGALKDAMEVTEPWHMMGTRADGAAVGRGRGPIGGCGQPRDCTPPTLEEVRDGPYAIPKGPLGPILDADPFEREGVPMGPITGYGIFDVKTKGGRWYGEGRPDDWPKDDYGDPFSSLRDAKRADGDPGDPVDASTPLTAPCSPCGHMLAYHGSFGGACDHLECPCPRFGKSW